MSAKKQRILLTDRQVGIVARDLNEFGFKVGFDEVRKIADAIAAGTHSESDPVALIICKQIDEAQEAIANRDRPGGAK